ncbi:hypothetical protein N7508_004055 [Penicillium antarcticum]|uniref:uncharacterized protein n=1 Tax=Penicillium antarcticum TaxID=416450 RepID=UPI00239DF4A0|nr:uncharacterized protein N7508_004055 [Penicillium antarcticum]KAJ5308676.1 hypothetical protein N7508_004055 [Penicillium antarcticum]
MRWPPWSPESTNDEKQSIWSSSNNSSSVLDWRAFVEPRTLVPTILLTSGILISVRIHRTYLRRIPDAPSISPSFLRRRSVFGQVTSVGDGDNFRIFHTPGGEACGLGLDALEEVKKELKDNTVRLHHYTQIHIRLAGIDAPELAHFGRPEQPFARDAHTWLTNYLTSKRVRALVHRQDQYSRVVASVYVRRAFDFPPFRRRDVSYEMLRRGLATVYEAKVGSEFGGEKMEKKYRRAEWWAKKRAKGLWRDYKAVGGNWESPREYKNRMGMGDSTLEKKK